MRVIGLISGTSVDGIDAALVELEGEGYELTVTLVAGFTQPYPLDLKQKILRVCAGQPITLADLASLDDAIADQFALATQHLLERSGPADLVASHGQTVFHRPLGSAVSSNGSKPLAYSLQLGRGATLARQVGLPTVSDFRRADIEVGGEGAPLVPIVDLCLLSHPNQRRCIQNIGGIGNVAYLPAWDPIQSPPPPVLGWDTGPGNSLIDIAMATLSEGTLAYDVDGAWAAQGTPCLELIEDWLDHPYFCQPPPKSTGRELFGWEYFDHCHRAAQQRGLSPNDLVATLTEFTAATIAQSYRAFLPDQPDAIFVGGGGSQNPVLMERLQAHFPTIPVAPTDAAGVSATYKEAMAFAVLGFWRWYQVPSNLPAVTGASSAVVLGHLNYP
jgi:anhydro-N-acetylmuramic acid kinase